MENAVINELNAFLEGNYMAIHAYERYIHDINDSKIRDVLQKIQQDHKQHATMIAERIQNLGGVPVNDVGFKGAMAEFVNNLKGSSHDPEFILQDALKGEERGIKMSKELVEGDLDPESLKLVKSILKHDEKHVDLLNQLIH